MVESVFGAGDQVVRVDHTAGIVTLAGLPADQVAALSQEAQLLNAIGDSSGYCQFVQATVSEVCEFLGAFIGRAVAGRELVDMGWQCLQTAWEFNRRAGFTDRDDDLPEFMKTEPIGEWSYVFDIDGATLRQVKDSLLPLAENFYHKPIF